MSDYPILSRINNPRDLSLLTFREVRLLAAEIRQLLVDTVAVTGGHLSSNLGAVEMTLALHRVFESPRDKIVWDVGHQAYAHKLVTGRRDQFETLRQHGGLSGFLVRDESPHDHFGAGHAGTSISAAMGMAVARDLAGDDYDVVAVIGDGSLTAGMALEGLNHLGHLGTRLIVILNDNEMSIAHNVGALSQALNRVRVDPRYHKAKVEVEQVMERFPMGGPAAKQTARRLLHSVKAFVLPNLFWEEMGFTFVGAVDGHDVMAMEDAFRRARLYTKPALIHVRTKKGHGYPPAEEDSTKWHGVAPGGLRKKVGPTYTQVFGDTLVREMQNDQRVVAITAAMPDGTGLVPASKSFPNRVYDVGISEQHAVTFAAGMATQGVIPVVAIYSTFLQRSFDQLVHDVCTQKLGVFFAIDRAGLVGDDGKTHQGVFDLSFLRCVPDLVIAAPKDENELQHLIHTGLAHIRDGLGAFALRYPRGAGTGEPMDEELVRLPIGKGELLREGANLAVVAIGTTVEPALEAAEMLAAEGIQLSVVNARFAKPMDEELILSVAQRCGRLMTVEENAIAGGFGSGVLEMLSARGVSGVQVEVVGLPDKFIEHGRQPTLRNKYGLDAEGIARTARKMLMVDEAPGSNGASPVQGPAEQQGDGPLGVVAARSFQ